MSDISRNDRLDQYLDDAYPEVIIGGLTFSPSRIIFELDPIAYNCMVSDLGLDEEESEDE